MSSVNLVEILMSIFILSRRDLCSYNNIKPEPELVLVWWFGNWVGLNWRSVALTTLARYATLAKVTRCGSLYENIIPLLRINKNTLLRRNKELLLRMNKTQFNIYKAI